VNNRLDNDRGGSKHQDRRGQTVEDVAVGKERNDALMLARTRVGVDCLVAAKVCGQRRENQDKEDQQDPRQPLCGGSERQRCSLTLHNDFT